MKINLEHEDHDRKVVINDEELDDFGVMIHNGDVHLQFEGTKTKIDISGLDWVDLEPLQQSMDIYIWKINSIFDKRKYTIIGLGNNKEEALQSIIKKAYSEDSEHSLAEYDQIIRKMISKIEPEIVKSYILWSD